MSDRLLAALDRMLPAALPQARRAPAAARRWGWQLLVGLAVFVIAELVRGISVYPIAALIGEGEPGTLVTWNSHPVSFLLAASLSALVAVAGYWALMRWIRGATVTELAGPGKLHEFLVGMGLGALLMTVVVALLAAVGCYRVTAVGWDAGILIGASSGLAAGFAEEILFRGVALRLLEQWLGTGWALALTAVLFGSAHLGEPEVSFLGAVAIMLEAGILLGACYLATRRLWLAFGTHVAWNFTQGGIFGFDVSGNGMGSGLFEARFTGPELLTGGDMGIDGSLVAVLVCAAAGVALLLVARRRGLLLRRQRAQAQ